MEGLSYVGGPAARGARAPGAAEGPGGPGSLARQAASGDGDAVPALLQLLHSPVSCRLKVRALSALRSMLRDNPATLAALAGHGTATACFLELLGCDCRPMRETAASLLRTLAAAGPEARDNIAAVDGGITALVGALQLPGCQMPAAHTLASLAAHSPALQQAVLAAGAIPALTACLVSSRTALQHAAVTALVALCTDCSDSMAVLVATVNANHLAALVQLVHCTDPAAAQQATLLLRQLAGSSSAVQEQLAAGVRPQAVQHPAAAPAPGMPTGGGAPAWRTPQPGHSPTSLQPSLGRDVQAGWQSRPAAHQAAPMSRPAAMRLQGPPLPGQLTPAGVAGMLPSVATMPGAAATAGGVSGELSAILAALQFSALPAPMPFSNGQCLGALAAVPSAAIAGAAAAEAMLPPPAAEAGVMALLELVRRSHSAAEQLSAAEALGLLAQGSPAAQAALLAGDGVRVLLRRLGSSRPAMRRAAATVLLQVALGGQAQLAAVQAEGGPQVLRHIQAALLADGDSTAALDMAAAAGSPMVAAGCVPASPPGPPARMPQPAVAPALRPGDASRQHVSNGNSMASLVGAVNGLSLSNDPSPSQYGTLASLHGLLHAPPADQQAYGPRSRSA